MELQLRPGSIQSGVTADTGGGLYLFVLGEGTLS